MNLNVIPIQAKLAMVTIADRWSQFFRITGGEGIAFTDRDTSLAGEYQNLVPKKLTEKGQFLAYDPNNGLGLYLPDVYSYNSLYWTITAADAQEIEVLGATPSPYTLTVTGGDGSSWLYDPMFYSDRRRTFFVTSAVAEARPTTVSRRVLAKIPAMDSTAQIAKVWGRVNLSTVNLSTTTSSPGSGGSFATKLMTTTVPLTRPSTHTAFTFWAFQHPYVTNILTNLNRGGVDGLYDPQPGKPGDELRRQLLSQPYFANIGGYDPAPAVTTPYPIDEFDFSPEGAYSTYNWELFFHVPFLIATKLAADQQFEDALKWFHYIFNPTEPLAPASTETAPQRFWKVKPFYQLTGAEADAESPIAILSLLLSHDDTDPARLAARKRLQDEVEQWRDNPFDPDVIARLRPVAYMKAVVIKYLDMLIAWGDQLFSQATRESINEAVQIYIMALRVLGKKPEKLPPVAVTALSYDDLAGTLDDFSDAVAKIETVLPPVNDDVSLGDANDSPADARSMYFCVPPNDKMLGYWDTVEDRLTKIRNCLSITGEPLSLPLFAPPIDPGLLIAARAAGLDIGSVLADVNEPPPLQRYSVLAARATELVSEVKAFGAQLLSALEKKDAEALALLRANQEIQLLAAMRVVKQDAVAEANANLAAAQAAQHAADTRYQYYNSRSFVNEGEGVQLGAIAAGAILRTIAAATESTGAAMAAIPYVDVGVSGWGAHATVKFGGPQFQQVASGGARALSALSTFIEMTGQAAGILGGFQRRQDEWNFQRDLAQIDRDEVTASQIAAATARQQTASDDLAAHDLQYQNAIDARDFMRDKFTNAELYDWMSSQLSALYFQSYKLAYAAAKRAERAWQYELADDSTFITFGYWESARKGLLAGERLSLDLKRMEMAYLDKDIREFELTRHIPLTELDPTALQKLRETGTCSFGILDTFFDADSPGHYMRRIKSVSLTLVGVTGPYTPVRSTLTLLSSQVRMKPQTGTDPDVLVTSSAPVQSIVTSTGRDDGGLFETSLRDERYLPFERAGAVSTWQLDVPTTMPNFDYRTVTDVVLHMRYTARDGGQTFREAVTTTLSGSTWTIGFSVKSAFSDAWTQFLSGSGSSNLTLNLDPDHIPFRASTNAGSTTITGISLVRVRAGAQGSAPSVTLTPPGGSSIPMATTSWSGAQFVASWSYSGQALGDYVFNGSTADFTADDDLIAIVTYTVP